jgi:hypothetical protein
MIRRLFWTGLWWALWPIICATPAPWYQAAAESWRGAFVEITLGFSWALAKKVEGKA